VIPGMIASPLSVDDGVSMGDDIQWGAGHDSFYEVPITLPPKNNNNSKKPPPSCSLLWFSLLVFQEPADSGGKYLLKSYLLWPNAKTELYRDRWLLAVENTMRNLSSWSLPTLTHPSYRYLAIHDRRKKNEMGQ